jgi:hypothetical protein
MAPSMDPAVEAHVIRAEMMSILVHMQQFAGVLSQMISARTRIFVILSLFRALEEMSGKFTDEEINYLQIEVAYRRKMGAWPL